MADKVCSCGVVVENLSKDLCKKCRQRIHRRNKSKKRRKKYKLRQYNKHRQRILAELIIEYGQKCFYCAKDLLTEEITLDHIIPISRGGSHKKENLRISCKACNLKKDNKIQ